MAELTQKQVAAIRAKQGRFPRSTEVQTVILTKTHGMTQRDAVSQVKNAGFKTVKVDIKKNSYRFRQKSPTEFIRKTFRTKEIKPGLQIVIGVPK